MPCVRPSCKLSWKGDAVCEALVQGKSGVVDLTQWKPGVFDALPTRIGAPIQDLQVGRAFHSVLIARQHD
jgi:hypothetical protein